MEETGPDIGDYTTDLREQIFHNNVREQIIFLLLFILLYLSSFALLDRYKRKGREDYYSSDEDEVTVYRISTWLCAFSLAVSIGAVLLLPISTVANEVLTLYPNSYYVKWLNISLIQGLWNYVFLLSFVSLIVLLPFAYLFTESEGFFGHRRGLMARFYETFSVLLLLTFVALGLSYVISSLIDKDKSSLQTLLDLWSYHLPFLYSCISFFGVIMLLVCTPLGFVRLFDVVGQFLIKPQFLRDINEEFFACALEEETVRRRLQHAQFTGQSYVSPAPMLAPVNTNTRTNNANSVDNNTRENYYNVNDTKYVNYSESIESYRRSCENNGRNVTSGANSGEKAKKSNNTKKKEKTMTNSSFGVVKVVNFGEFGNGGNNDEGIGNGDHVEDYQLPKSLLKLRNGELQSGLSGILTKIEAKRKLLDKQRHTSSLRRNVVYPIATLLLIGLTVVTVLIVVQNTIELLIGMKALPLSSRQFVFGISSLSRLGTLGAGLEIILILYLIVTSSIGLYSSPPISRIRPRKRSTPFNLIIANCALVLILSSALPLLAKILGITNFDLLGDYGSIEWLGNFKLVLLYNLVFAGAATLCLVNKCTGKVRRELYARFLNFMGGNPID